MTDTRQSSFAEETRERQARLQCLDPRRLHLILLPTEQCSFRCTYCYEDFSIGRMSDQVKSGVKALLDQRAHDLEQLDISWFGGEPLVARDIVFDIHDHIRNLTGHFRLNADMTTNGFHLDRQTFLALCERGVRTFQITLDGQPAQHNQTRQGKGGFPTFDTIYRNLSDMARTAENFTVILRLHFHPANVESMRGLTQRLMKDFAGDTRFKLYFKSLSHLGGSQDHVIPIFDAKHQRTTADSLKSIVGDPGMLIHGDPDSYVCYAAHFNSLVIRADGRVAKCTVALKDPCNDIGTLNESGQLAIDHEKLRHWTRGVATGERRALRCPMSA